MQLQNVTRFRSKLTAEFYGEDVLKMVIILRVASYLLHCSPGQILMVFLCHTIQQLAIYEQLQYTQNSAKVECIWVG